MVLITGETVCVVGQWWKSLNFPPIFFYKSNTVLKYKVFIQTAISNLVATSYVSLLST